MDEININQKLVEQTININPVENINIDVSQEAINIDKKTETYALKLEEATDFVLDVNKDSDTILNLDGNIVQIEANYPQAIEAARIATEKAAEATQVVEGFDTHAQEKITEYDSNASHKIAAYNLNATEKTNAFNSNATDKTDAFNLNTTSKTSDFNSNASDKTTAFNSNATSKTGDFNDNATSKTNTFNDNATSKTTAFNENASEKQALVDASALAASQSAVEAKQWAIGDPSEPVGNSAKYWAGQAQAELSGLTSRVSTIEGKIPAQASSSNQLADKEFVNSSISTNTANFIGTFASVSDLEGYSGTVTNNDYAFVVNRVVTDNGNDWATFTALNAYDKSLLSNFDYAWVINGANFDLYRFDIVNQVWELRASNIEKSSVTLNSAYNRYKAVVSGSTTWTYEYTLNNSSFTAGQWQAINSGITADLVAEFEAKGALLDYTGNTLTLEDSDGNALSSVTIQSSPDLDNKSITKNASQELQTVGVINSRDSSTAVKTWTGTKAQYDAIVSKDSNTLYNITDDTDVSLTILEALYPVGSVYITTASTCPLSALISGSTWELVSSGRVLQGADNDHSAGTTIEAGLPNIYTEIATRKYEFGVGPIHSVSGAGTFNNNGYTAASNVYARQGGTSTYALQKTTIDASVGNSIYGNSTTVQPPAYVVNIYRRTA